MDTAPFTWRLALFVVAFPTVVCGFTLSSTAMAKREPQPPMRLIGYYDARSQKDLHINHIPHGNLTHVVLTGAVKVDANGSVMYRHPEHPSEKTTEELIKSLADLPNVKLVVSIRGFPDDVALDELAENDTTREKFGKHIANLTRDLGVDGLEIEWHSDDPGGGKAIAAPFDIMEQYHFALLCRTLSLSLRSAGNKSLSVAVRPGRQEFAEGRFVQKYVDWLALRAYSMRSLGDPHHASLKDMSQALDEWTLKGVPNKQLVLGTPLFARPGGSLHTIGDRNEGLRKSWKDLSVDTGAEDVGNSAYGDVFRDVESGKVWWLSGINTTKAKVRHVLKNGYGGVALRDLHFDSKVDELSLVKAAKAAALQHAEEVKRRPRDLDAVLFQRGMIRSKTAPGDIYDRGHGEL